MAKHAGNAPSRGYVASMKAAIQRMRPVRLKVSQQRNHFDCGLYLVRFSGQSNGTLSEARRHHDLTERFNHPFIPSIHPLDFLSFFFRRALFVGSVLCLPHTHTHTHTHTHSLSCPPESFCFNLPTVFTIDHLVRSAVSTPRNLVSPWFLSVSPTPLFPVIGSCSCSSILRHSFFFGDAEIGDTGEDPQNSQKSVPLNCKFSPSPIRSAESPTSPCHACVCVCILYRASS